MFENALSTDKRRTLNKMALRSSKRNAYDLTRVVSHYLFEAPPQAPRTTETNGGPNDAHAKLAHEVPKNSGQTHEMPTIVKT